MDVRTYDEKINSEIYDELKIEGVRCTLRERGEGGPVICWGMFPFGENEEEHLTDCLTDLMPDRPFVLAAFQAEDWNRDFSPWAAPAAFGNEDFSGGGPVMLSWLTEKFAPFLKERFGESREYYIAGYSLSGLFALWTMYECELFDGAACCSGSLWFEGWSGYVSSRRVKRNCRIYLSLGGKEEKTKNAVMATVGDRTREQEKVLKADRNVREVVLDWNSGGHFADSGKRLAKGICWLTGNR